MHTKRRLPLILILAGLALVVFWIGFKTWRVASHAQSLLEHQAEVEALTANGFTQADPEQLESIVVQVREDVVAIEHELGPWMPLVERLDWMPGLGASLAAAPHLLEMADAGTEALILAMPLLKQTLVFMQAENRPDAPLAELMYLLDGSETELVQATQAIDRLVSARDQIKHIEKLPGRVQTLLSKFDERRELVIAAPRIAQVLPDIMGVHEERTYLILAQNEDELRPTGGFISGAGLLHLSGGSIVDVFFQDANLIDDWKEKAYDWPPEPLIELMGLELYLFRDTNFWPDFPTSAEQAITMYQYSQDYGEIDGVIAIDQQLLVLLLGISGPIEITEMALRINQSNAITQMRSAWSADEGQTAEDWILGRKDFMSLLAGEMRNQIEENIISIDPLLLADTMIAALEEKHLQLYMRHPDEAGILDELNWDGRLENTPAQDLVMAVDTNVGYNKSNPLVTSSLHYAVKLSATGDGEAELHLTYQHNGESDGRPCAQGVDEVYDAAGSYEGLIDGCYMNFLRVYAPLGSELQEATRHTAPPSAFYNARGWDRPAYTAPEHPLVTTFANFFMLPEGETLETSFLYHLPVVTTNENGTFTYYLRFFKQAGAGPQPLTITITLPDGTEIMEMEPADAVVDGQTISFSRILDRDQTFIITYR